jgi:hypothetical protein
MRPPAHLRAPEDRCRSGWFAWATRNPVQASDPATAWAEAFSRGAYDGIRRRRRLERLVDRLERIVLDIDDHAAASDAQLVVSLLQEVAEVPLLLYDLRTVLEHVEINREIEAGSSYWRSEATRP